MVAAALGVFLWLAMSATLQPIAVSVPWIVILSVATLVFLVVSGTMLWRRTRFS